MFSWDGNGDATKTKVGVVFRERTIHVPRERDDGTAKENVLYLVIFQSTFLVRGTTPLIVTTNIPIEISIHIPRERDDKKPHRNRHGIDGFQSTSLVRGTTLGVVK